MRTERDKQRKEKDRQGRLQGKRGKDIYYITYYSEKGVQNWSDLSYLICLRH